MYYLLLADSNTLTDLFVHFNAQVAGDSEIWDTYLAATGKSRAAMPMWFKVVLGVFMASNTLVLIAWDQFIYRRMKREFRVTSRLDSSDDVPNTTVPESPDDSNLSDVEHKTLKDHGVDAATADRVQH